MKPKRSKPGRCALPAQIEDPIDRIDGALLGGADDGNDGDYQVIELPRLVQAVFKIVDIHSKCGVHRDGNKGAPSETHDVHCLFEAVVVAFWHQTIGRRPVLATTS